MHAFLTTDAETPAAEYDRRIDEQRSVAERTIARCLKWWLLGQGAGVASAAAAFAALIFGIAFRPVPEPWAAYAVLAGIILAVAAAIGVLVATGTAAVVAVKNWSVMRRRWKVVGLGMWLFLSTEAIVMLLEML